MKAFLILGDAASQHPDGTFSILRAGIDRIGSPGLPASFQGALVVRMAADIGDSGAHTFDLRCLDADGGMVIPQISGQFAVPAGGGTNVIILNIGMMFQKYGDFVFVFRVDNHIQGEWLLRTEQRDLPQT
jgi:hypothetical protein